jgi:hypothetical protein
MSSMPTPKLSDPELRLKRDSLAWEIRKFRMDLRVRAKNDADRLQLERERFDLERKKLKRDASFWVRLGPTAITSTATVVGAMIALFGVLGKQEAAKTSSEAGAYISQHAAELKAEDVPAQIEQRARILSSNPEPVAKEIFARLVKQSDSAATRQVWSQGLQAAESAGQNPAAAGATVYVQYQEPTNDAALKAVMGTLTKAGYYVPGKQKVVQETSGDIRYSAAPDDTATEAAARNIASLVQQALQSVNIQRSLRPINIRPTFPKAPSSTFEVWLPALGN